MKKIVITKKDLNDDNYYKQEEIGKWNDYENVNVEIEENLGYVRFIKGVYVNGSIVCKAGSGIGAGWGIEAGSGIEAGEGIEAGSGIEAGEGIKAGWGIEAGEGIKAGLFITCKLSISWAYKMFAGICYWRNITDDEKTITCGKLEPKNGAVVEYGIVKETGENGKKEELLKKADELIEKANELKEQANNL